MIKTILILDDEQMITKALSGMIRMVLKHNVMVFNDPKKALEDTTYIYKDVDLIITDFMMPGMNGLEFLKCFKEKNPETISILLTGYADKENAIKSINEVGLYYYLEKPWDNNMLIRIIQNGLEKKDLTDSLNESTREINRLYQLLKNDFQQEVDNVKNLIISLANLIEAKDVYTDDHTRRVGTISRLIGENLGLDKETLDCLEISGTIHDIGKVGVPEEILNKPGKLTAHEYDLMKKHPALGENICRPLNTLKKCLDPIRHHHEKLDGSGYPDGLIGAEISLEARIVAVADIFDALYSDRPYRNKMPLEKAKAILTEEAKKNLVDKNIVEILFKLIDNGLIL